MDIAKEQLEEQLKQLPDRPGVYLMKDRPGEIIYVGKARSLRKRVRSYFRKGNHTYKTSILIKHITDFDYIVTDTEVEAFILEANLIKKHHPRFNIRLKDDKSYPFIKVTLNEDFPRVFKTRVVKSDGAHYYGPFSDVDVIYKTIQILKELFALRSCRKDIRAGQLEDRPCLNYYIGKCLGPCIGEVDRDTYREMIEKVCLFLSGRHDELIKRVEELMHQAAEERNFEKAARLRDSINALRKVTTQQKVMSERNLNQDVIAIADEQEGRACAQVLIIRNGRLIGQEYFMLTGSEDEEREEILASFLQQFYEQGQQVPDELLLDTVPVQAQLLEEWLKGLKGKKVFLTHPERGEKKRLLEMAVQIGRAHV